MAAMAPITADQREVLRDLMAYRLFIIGDRRLAAAVLAGTPHEQLAEEFGQDLRLMEDLGWDRAIQGEVVLTMRRRPLELTLRRMRHDAEQSQADGALPRRPSETQKERVASFQLAERVCDDLLAALS